MGPGHCPPVGVHTNREALFTANSVTLKWAEFAAFGGGNSKATWNFPRKPSEAENEELELRRHPETFEERRVSGQASRKMSVQVPE